KTLEIAQANQLGALRQNLTPDAQRRVDHIQIEAYTDDPVLAEELAPIEGQEKLPPSIRSAQLATDRLLRGLPFEFTPEMVPEDYVQVWMMDLGVLVQQIQAKGGQTSMEELAGIGNLIQNIEKFLQVLAADKNNKHKVRQYHQVLMGFVNHLR